jgi:hypothetical protein
VLVFLSGMNSRSSRLLSHVPFTAWITGFSLVLPTHSLAADQLPYTTRTRGYTGISTTITGDLRTIGMAGAPSAVSDSVTSASQENPAALSMAMDGAGLQIISVETADAQLQDFDQPVSRGSFGLGASVYPWGFAFSQQTQRAEGQDYEVSGNPISPDIRLREYRFSASRVLLDNKLALGVSFISDQATQRLEKDVEQSQSGLNWGVGAIYQFPRRWFGGISFTAGKTLKFDPEATPSLPGFHQDMKLPWRANIGAGWVPNRLFMFSSTIAMIGPEGGSALLSDESRRVGEEITFQPRIGASYRWIDMRAIRGRVNLGTYYETSRLADASSRMHLTGSLEIEPWIFNFGWGFDIASNYRNTIYSGTVDLGQLAEILDIIPRPNRPAARGVLPSPQFLSDEGLARPMATHWGNRSENRPDVIELGKELPDKLRDRIVDNPESSLKAIGKDFIETLGTVPADVTGQPKPKTKPKDQPKAKAMSPQRPSPKPKVAKPKSIR